MTLGGRIHAVAAAFAVGYLFIGSVFLRSDGALAVSVPKVLLGVGVAWVVWMATGGDEKKGSVSGDLEAPAVESRDGTVLGCGAMGTTRPTMRRYWEGSSATTRRSRSDSPYRGSPDRMKRRSELAFCDGRIVEAAYWLAIALLHGGTDRSGRMKDYVEAWLAMDCPDEVENVHAGFNAAQGSFGRSVLRFWSKGYRDLAISRFTQMAQSGDADARAFLEMYGVKAESGGAA